MAEPDKSLERVECNLVDMLTIPRALLVLALLQIPSLIRPREVHAQATDAPAPTHRWGVETELIQPFIPTVHILQVRLTRTLWGELPHARGDVIVGFYARPDIEHDVVESISEYMGEIGYRHYFWRGLHAEALLFGGKAWGTNKFDGKYYSPTTLFASTNLGYRLDFFEPGGFSADRPGAVGFYVAAQVGLLTSAGYLGLDVNDIGPRDGKPDWFLQGNLLVGASF
jgi:hypothetical protein